MSTGDNVTTVGATAPSNYDLSFAKAEYFMRMRVGVLTTSGLLSHFMPAVVTCPRISKSMASLQQNLRAAYEIRLDLSTCLSTPLHRLVTCHADALGVPPEFILYPLITSVAACQW